MYLHNVAKDNFVLLQATWTVENVRQLIERLNPTHVIVHRTAPKDYYYLFTKSQALNYISRSSDQSIIHDAFCLHEYTSTPTLDGYTNADTIPDRCIVIEDGHPIGFFDVTIPFTPETRRGNKTLEFAKPVSRSLVADFPEQVPLEQTVSLLVSLSVDLNTGMALSIALPMGNRVDIVVQPKCGFVVEGVGEGSLMITDEEETLPLQFKLKATTPGPGKIRILAFYQGQSLGAITLAPTVVPATQTEETQRTTHEQRLSPVSVSQPRSTRSTSYQTANSDLREYNSREYSNQGTD